jgi:hypothetical protein
MRRHLPLLVLLAALLPQRSPAATSIERRLYADRVDSSSFLWNDWNRFQENYHPLYAADDDPKTAWVEGAKSAGDGEWLRFNLSHLDRTSLVRLRIQNGYQKSNTLYKANGRAREVTITLLPSGVSTKATLTDGQSWQELQIAQPEGVLEAVELRVDSVYAGSKYSDLCVSDVQIFATSSVPDNPAVEKARYDRVLRWKADRIAAAAAFADQSKGALPIASSYALHAEAPSPIDDQVNSTDPLGTARLALAGLQAIPGEPGLPRPDAAIAIATTGLATSFAGWTPVQTVAKDTRAIPRVDGLAAATLWNCFEGPPVWGNSETGGASGDLELPVANQLGFLRTDGLSTFALSKSPTLAEVLSSSPSNCRSGQQATYSWALMTAATDSQPARVQALMTVTCGEVESREGSEQVSVPQLLVYDEKGQLALIVGQRSAISFGWRGEGSAAVLSDARRVGQWTPTVRLREASRSP